jgi:lipopolysaccharide biosynthesis glycosyltransferase
MQRTEEEGPVRSRPVVFACDSAYAMPLATTLRSMVESDRAGWPHDVNVLCDGFSDATRGRVLASLPEGSASIRWIPVDLRQYADLSAEKYPSKMVCARLLIPRIFPESVSRVLYLDADLLILDSLEPLWEVALDGAVVGAVLDGLDTQIREGRPNVEALPRVRSYFNSGVLLINLDRWRQERVSEKAEEYLGRHPDSPFPDQDALNVACDGLWKRLDERWNLQVMQYTGRELRETAISALPPERRPAIVHFVTSLKPWITASLSANASLYDGYRSRTSFGRSGGERLRDGAMAVWFRLKRRFRRYRVLRSVWNALGP